MVATPSLFRSSSSSWDFDLLFRFRNGPVTLRRDDIEDNDDLICEERYKRKLIKIKCGQIEYSIARIVERRMSMLVNPLQLNFIYLPRFEHL